MSEPNDFFVAGGTMRPQSPSYITRPADQELYRHALAGEFCYVLTTRQMGKSSLMVRAARQLEAEGVRTVIIDLTSIGTVSVDDWYLGLLSRICSNVQLSVNPARWWAEHRQLGHSQRFIEFLRDVVLAEIDAPIVIFIDEIDTTLNLDFRDDFFAAIRAMYNERAIVPEYQRLTFVLLGVATPIDLIQDRHRTPFNIGRQIVLEEFSYADAVPLRQGLELHYARQNNGAFEQSTPDPGRAESASSFHKELVPAPSPSDTLLRAIFGWTSGHPYLTQKLCQLVAATEPSQWNETVVDALVQDHFLAKDAPDENLKFVQNRVQSTEPSRRWRMLRLYQQIHAGKIVPDDDRSHEQNYLELFGLIRLDGQQLRVRNQIYSRVFDQKWINAAKPPIFSSQIFVTFSIVAVYATFIRQFVLRFLPWIMSLLAALAVGGAAAIMFANRDQTAESVIPTHLNQFRSNSNPEVRFAALTGLFKLQQTGPDATLTTEQARSNSSAVYQSAPACQAARRLFFALPHVEQLQLFLQTQPNAPDLTLVVRGLIPALNTVDQNDSDPDVIEAMGTALSRVSGADTTLADGLKSWSVGRRAAAQGNYPEAIKIYQNALQGIATPEHNNPALHYDWALALANLKLYSEALREFNIVIAQAEADPTSKPADVMLANLKEQLPAAPAHFINANNVKDLVARQLSQNSGLLAALQRTPGKFPTLDEAYGALLANLAGTQTAVAQQAAATSAAAAQATVQAVGGATATTLGQTALAQASAATSAAEATGTSLAVAIAATPIPTQTNVPKTKTPAAGATASATAIVASAATEFPSDEAATPEPAATPPTRATADEGTPEQPTFSSTAPPISPFPTQIPPTSRPIATATSAMQVTPTSTAPASTATLSPELPQTPTLSATPTSKVALTATPQPAASPTSVVGGTSPQIIVAPSGNDANDCTSFATACQTISAAVSKTINDQTILIEPGTYAERLVISHNLNLIGTSAGTTIIDGGQTGTVLTIAPGANVSLESLTVQNGVSTTGGGILNRGTLTIKNSSIINNRAIGANGQGGPISGPLTGGAPGNANGFGGGIYNAGTLTLDGTTMGGNVALGGKGGSNSSFGSGGGGGGAGLGGAIFNDGASLTITNSTFSTNQATGGSGNYGGPGFTGGGGGGGGTGGAGGNGGGASGSAGAFGGGGGGAGSGSTLDAAGGMGGTGGFGGGGGGGASANGPSGAGGFGGGAGGAGGSGGGGAGGGGGGAGAAIFNRGGQLNVSGSTFTGNQAVGGNGLDVASCSGGVAGNGGDGRGGAIFNYNGSLADNGNAFSGNQVSGGAGGTTYNGSDCGGQAGQPGAGADPDIAIFNG